MRSDDLGGGQALGSIIQRSYFIGGIYLYLFGVVFFYWRFWMDTVRVHNINRCLWAGLGERIRVFLCLAVPVLWVDTRLLPVNQSASEWSIHLKPRWFSIFSKRCRGRGRRGEGKIWPSPFPVPELQKLPWSQVLHLYSLWSVCYLTALYVREAWFQVLLLFLGLSSLCGHGRKQCGAEK